MSTPQDSYGIRPPHHQPPPGQATVTRRAEPRASRGLNHPGAPKASPPRRARGLGRPAGKPGDRARSCDARPLGGADQDASKSQTEIQVDPTRPVPGLERRYPARAAVCLWSAEIAAKGLMAPHLRRQLQRAKHQPMSSFQSRRQATRRRVGGYQEQEPRQPREGSLPAWAEAGFWPRCPAFGLLRPLGGQKHVSGPAASAARPD